MTIDSKFINEFVSTQDYLSQARLSRVRSGDQEFFQLTAEEWLGHQDIPTEKVTYASLSTGIIKEIEYEGSNRYLENPAEQNFKIILHLRNVESLAKLARLLEHSRFKQVGLLDTIRFFSEDSILALHFSQERLKKNVDYLDELFALISQIETLPIALLTDLKSVIAYNCVERFKRRLATDGFTKAFKLLRQAALKGTLHPFYVAALHCRQLGQFKEAHHLIRTISKDHPSYEIARTVERAMYKEQINNLQNQINRLEANPALLKKVSNHEQNHTLLPNNTQAITYPNPLRNNIEVFTSHSIPLQAPAAPVVLPKTVVFSTSLREGNTTKTAEPATKSLPTPLLKKGGV